VTLDGVLDCILDLLSTYIHLGTTSNYSAIANYHTLQITNAHAKSFPARSVFTSSCLVTASNNGYSFASGLPSNCLLTAPFLHSLPYRTDIFALIFFLITPRHGPRRIHRLQQYLYCCMRIRCCGNLFTEPLPRNDSGILAYSRSLHSNGSARYSINEIT
jgi:hypothetical protein